MALNFIYLIKCYDLSLKVPFIIKTIFFVKWDINKISISVRVCIICHKLYFTNMRTLIRSTLVKNVYNDLISTTFKTGCVTLFVFLLSFDC